MKPLLLTLAVLFGFNSSLKAAAAKSTTKPVPPMVWRIKTLFQLETQITLATPAEEPSHDGAQLQVRADAKQSVAEIISPVMTTLSQLTDENSDELAKIVLQASTALTQAAKALALSHPGVSSTLNFIIYPAVQDQPGDALPTALSTEEPTFVSALLNNMRLQQLAKFGQVKQGKSPLYILGAAVAIKLAAKGSEARVQFVTSINPQEIEGETPISVPQVKKASDATVMFLEVVQPIALTLPKLSIKFGKLGELRRDGYVYHFDIDNNESMCSRMSSVPKIWQSKGVWIPLPLYSVVIDLNKIAIVDADIRLGIMGCWNFGYVRDQFMTQGNQKINEAKNIVTNLLGSSPEEFAEIIAKERASAGISTSVDGN